MDDKLVKLEKAAAEIRRMTIEMIGKLGIGHIGGCLSIVEVLAVLYCEVMNIDPARPDWEKRDRFILSKGHGGPALYAALAYRGYFGREELDTLNRPDTNLPSHCDMRRTRGVDMTAGSLGQGISAAVGMALGARMDQNPCRIYCIIGDGESQEGQVWEAAMFAGHKKLDNLTVFLDYNKMQIDDYVYNVNTLEPLAEKWKAFGWHVRSVDGHDIRQLLEAVKNAQMAAGQPSIIIMNTVKGKGAYFAEGKLGSHNMPVTVEQWQKAVLELDKT